jgi:hypothetical protein
VEIDNGDEASERLLEGQLFSIASLSRVDKRITAIKIGFATYSSQISFARKAAFYSPLRDVERPVRALATSRVFRIIEASVAGDFFRPPAFTVIGKTWLVASLTIQSPYSSVVGWTAAS